MSYSTSILSTSAAGPAQGHQCVVSDDAPQASTPSLLPSPLIESAAPLEPMLTRRAVLDLKLAYKEQRAQAARQTRGLHESAQRNALYKEIRGFVDEEEKLEQHLAQHFISQHGPEQFFSPRAFLVSRLFRVCSKALKRQAELDFLLPTQPGHCTIRYCGPELRQSDGRVFLALLSMLRDVQVGTPVRIDPEALCRALYRRYDGNSRTMLREHLERLPQAKVVSKTFSVQLCLGFECRRMGGWTVTLDPHLVDFFRLFPVAWFPMKPRLQLTDGLATWLCTFIESQTRLIPMRIELLRELCGSEAHGRAFTNSLRLALQRVAAAGVIDTGWTLLRGEVRWLKRRDNPARS